MWVLSFFFEKANVKTQISKGKFQKANLPFEICLLYFFENFKTQISKRKFQNANFKTQISKGKFAIKIVKCGFSTKTNLCFQPNPNLSFWNNKCGFSETQIHVYKRQMCVLQKANLRLHKANVCFVKSKFVFA